jgi:hypothetical protein
MALSAPRRAGWRFRQREQTRSLRKERSPDYPRNFARQSELAVQIV